MPGGTASDGGESGGDDAAGASGSNEVAAEEQSMHDGAGRGGKHDIPVCGSTPDDPCPSRETPGGGAGPGGMLWVEVPRAVATANAVANTGQTVAGAHAKAHAVASSIRTHAKAHGHRVGQILEEHSSQIEDLLLAAHVPGNLNPTTQQQQQQQQHGTKGKQIEQSMGADGERPQLRGSVGSSSESSSSSGPISDSGPESSSSDEPAGSNISSTGNSSTSSNSSSSSGSGSSNSSTADDSSTNISSLTSGVGSSDATTGSPKSVEIDSVGSSNAVSTNSSSSSSSRSDSGSSSSGIGSASGSGSAVTTPTEEPAMATTTSTLAPTVETTTTTTSTSSTVCVDTPKGWASSTAVNCQQYAERKWCNDTGGYGTGWKKGYVSFAKWANKGVDATQACCVCGGGSTATAAGPPNDAFSKIAERPGGANPQQSDKNIQYDSGSGCSASTHVEKKAQTSNMEEQEQKVMGEVAQQAMSKMDEEPQNERVRVPL